MATTRGGIFSLRPTMVALFRITNRLEAKSGPHQEERCQKSAEHDIETKTKSRPPQRDARVFNEQPTQPIKNSVTDARCHDEPEIRPESEDRNRSKHAADDDFERECLRRRSLNA